MLIGSFCEKSWAQRQLELFPKNRSYARLRNKAETGLAKDPVKNHLAASVQANIRRLSEVNTIKRR
jgi:hypothetical protein